MVQTLTLILQIALSEIIHRVKNYTGALLSNTFGGAIDRRVDISKVPP